MCTLVIRYVFANEVQTRYYVGPDEGYSVMESLAYRFKEHELGTLLDLIYDFYDNQEKFLADAPSNCRSMTMYPIKINALVD